MTDEVVKPKPVTTEPPEQKFSIPENQLFKIQVVLKGNTIRDEFTGFGSGSFDQTLEFARKICQIYKGSKIRVLVRTRHL